MLHGSMLAGRFSVPSLYPSGSKRGAADLWFFRLSAVKTTTAAIAVVILKAAGCTELALPLLGTRNKNAEVRERNGRNGN